MNLLLVFLALAVSPALAMDQSSERFDTCATTVCPLDSRCIEEFGETACFIPPNAQGEPKECPKANYIFNTCSNRCAPKCGQYGEIECPDKYCGYPKCECKKGFYLNDNGDCVTREECDATLAVTTAPEVHPRTLSPIPECKKNQVFSDCVSWCPDTCGKEPTDVCIRPACQDGCECKKGFYLNSTGDCVTREECDIPFPPTTGECKKNQVFSDCVSWCPDTCGKKPTDVCIRPACQDGCECKKGFYLNSKGDCVTRGECDIPFPPTTGECKKNQILTKCYPTFTATCEQRLPIRPSPMVCGGTPKCVCKPRFYLNNNGECVTGKECDKEYFDGRPIWE